MTAPCPPAERRRPRNYLFQVYGQDNGTVWTTSPVDASVTLDYAFAIDQTEVTVGAFQSWLYADAGVPQDGTSLDPNGPYKSLMVWDGANWNGYVYDPEYQEYAGYEAGLGCGNPGQNVGATFGAGNPQYPMNCVNWFQAQAGSGPDRLRGARRERSHDVPARLHRQLVLDGWGRQLPGLPVLGEPARGAVRDRLRVVRRPGLPLRQDAALTSPARHALRSEVGSVWQRNRPGGRERPDKHLNSRPRSRSRSLPRGRVASCLCYEANDSPTLRRSEGCKRTTDRGGGCR